MCVFCVWCEMRLLQQWKTDYPEPRKGLPASVTSIIPQQTCLSLCQEHSDACDAAFSRVQQLRADGTAKSNTSQQCPFTAVPCYQMCASFRRVHFFIFCSTRAYVQKPDSPLSHLKPHKHTIHPPPPTGSGPFLPRLPDAERDSGAEWGRTRALVSPVKAKDLVRPSIPLGSPSNTHIATKYCKGTSRSSASYILMLLSGYKLLDFV